MWRKNILYGHVPRIVRQLLNRMEGEGDSQAVSVLGTLEEAVIVSLASSSAISCLVVG